jgi:hypothetical protein
LPSHGSHDERLRAVKYAPAVRLSRPWFHSLLLLSSPLTSRRRRIRQLRLGRNSQQVSLLESRKFLGQSERGHGRSYCGRPSALAGCLSAESRKRKKVGSSALAGGLKGNREHNEEVKQLEPDRRLLQRQRFVTLTETSQVGHRAY